LAPVTSVLLFPRQPRSGGSLVAGCRPGPIQDRWSYDGLNTLGHASVKPDAS